MKYKYLFLLLSILSFNSLAITHDETLALVEKFNNYFNKNIPIEIVKDECMPQATEDGITYCEEILDYINENDLQHLWKLVIAHEYAHVLFDFSISEVGGQMDSISAERVTKPLSLIIDEKELKNHFIARFGEYYDEFGFEELISYDLVDSLSHNAVDMFAKKLLIHFDEYIEVETKDFALLDEFLYPEVKDVHKRINAFRANALKEEVNLACMKSSLEDESSYVDLKNFMRQHYQADYVVMFTTCSDEAARAMLLDHLNAIK